MKPRVKKIFEFSLSVILKSWLMVKNENLNNIGNEIEMMNGIGLTNLFSEIIIVEFIGRG